MKNKKINLLMVVCAILIQRILFQLSVFQLYRLPFATGLMIFESNKANLLLVLYVFIPIPFILFEFSGKVQELTEGYGKLWIIRSYKRERLYLKLIGNCGLELLAIVVFSVVVFSFADERWSDFSGIQMILIILTYYHGLMAIVLLQLYLEFFMESSYANIITNIFFVFSLFLGNSVLVSDRSFWLGIIFFPNMLFGTRNGIINQETVCIKYEYAILYIVMVFLILCLLTMKKFRKKDIY